MISQSKFIRSDTPTSTQCSTPTISEPEIQYLRKRTTDFQYYKLKALYETKAYPTREERRALSEEIGMDYKAVTLWFQNRRGSENRKAWTRNDRAKKRAAAQLASLQLSKQSMSLDRVASLSERPLKSTNIPSPSETSPATPKKQSPKALADELDVKPDIWQCMPSSPPQPPSSPAEIMRYSLNTPEVSGAKSLEWACAKARVIDKWHQRGKENQVSAKPHRRPKRQPFTSPCDGADRETSTSINSSGARTPCLTTIPVQTPASRPSTGSAGSAAVPPGSRVGEMWSQDHEKPEDMEVALLLLGFRKA